MVDPAAELEEEGGVQVDTWEWWNQLRTLCSDSNSLGLGELTSISGVHNRPRLLIIYNYIFFVNYYYYCTRDELHCSCK